MRQIDLAVQILPCLPLFGYCPLLLFAPPFIFLKLKKLCHVFFVLGSIILHHSHHKSGSMSAGWRSNWPTFRNRSPKADRHTAFSSNRCSTLLGQTWFQMSLRYTQPRELQLNLYTLVFQCIYPCDTVGNELRSTNRRAASRLPSYEVFRTDILMHWLVICGYNLCTQCWPKTVFTAR